MTATEWTIDDVAAVRDVDLDAALDPAEPDGVYRDSRQCAVLALQAGGGKLLASPPTPRPKKG